MISDSHHYIRDAHRYCDERSIYRVNDSRPEPRYVDLDEAAERMNMTRAQVMLLVRSRALRALPIPGDEPLVEPAILTGTIPQEGK